MKWNLSGRASSCPGALTSLVDSTTFPESQRPLGLDSWEGLGPLDCLSILWPRWGSPESPLNGSEAVSMNFLPVSLVCFSPSRFYFLWWKLSTPISLRTFSGWREGLPSCKLREPSELSHRLPALTFRMLKCLVILHRPNVWAHHLYAEGNRNCKRNGNTPTQTCLFTSEGIIEFSCAHVCEHQSSSLLETVLLLLCVIFSSPCSISPLPYLTFQHYTSVSLGSCSLILQGPVLTAKCSQNYTALKKEKWWASLPSWIFQISIFWNKDICEPLMDSPIWGWTLLSVPSFDNKWQQVQLGILGYLPSHTLP